MGWERGRYYTRSRKVAGRVVREYVGGGVLGLLSEEQDARGREEREAERSALREAQAEADAVDASIDTLTELAGLVAQAAMLAAGFRQHKRGDWRKKRVKPNDSR